MVEHVAAPLIVPNPDPSEMTREYMAREITNLRDMITTRVDAIDKATALFEENLTRVPTEVDKQIAHLREFHDEKFRTSVQKFLSIQNQFDERDIRSNKAEVAQKEFAAAQAVAAQVANTVALSAQKEAAAAQNTFFTATMQERQAATTKQIDNTTTLLNSSTKASDDKIAALTVRLASMEGNSQGHAANQSQMVLAIGVAVSVLMGLYNVFSHPNAAPPAPYYVQGPVALQPTATMPAPQPR